MKSWVLHRVQGVAGRADLPSHDSVRAHEPDLVHDAGARSAAPAAGADALHAGADLGAYGPLIAAVRERLLGHVDRAFEVRAGHRDQVARERL